MKRIITYMLAGASLLPMASCSDFLDTVPHNALAPSNTWKTEDDAHKFLIGCLDGWFSTGDIFFGDCLADFGYNNFPWDNWQFIANGTISPGEEDVKDYYQFGRIRRCNDFLANIEKVSFADESKKNDMKAQVMTIRAFKYFNMNWVYGGVPIIDSYASREEAMVPRNTEEEVNKFIEDELDKAIPMFQADRTEKNGYLDRATALTIKMRHALYYEKWDRAKSAAAEIMKMGFGLHPDYAELFSLKGRGSNEIIHAAPRIVGEYDEGLEYLYNNGVGGWSSSVPTKNLVDAYETINGLTKEEDPAYDATHPFANRDPRLYATIIYPGADFSWKGAPAKILNTLDMNLRDENGDYVLNSEGKNEKNPNYPTFTSNSSKSGLTWGKYLLNPSQYGSDMWSTDCSPILFRYAEVLLSWCEAENEQNGPSVEVYGYLNQIRNRAGMPSVDEGKYGTKETLRELIRRERGVEMAGEGLRRPDILRWKDASGKMLAEKLLNGNLIRFKGTIDYKESDPTKRAVIDTNVDLGDEKQLKEVLIENRVFEPKFRYLPIPQNAMDKNNKLEQWHGW